VIPPLGAKNGKQQVANRTAKERRGHSKRGINARLSRDLEVAEHLEITRVGSGTGDEKPPNSTQRRGGRGGMLLASWC